MGVDTRRVFYVTSAEMTEDMLVSIPTTHDGIHLELFYNLIFADIGMQLPAHLRPVAWALADSGIKKLMVIMSPGAGKAVEINTPVLSERGWIPIKDTQIGDRIYSKHGKKTTILGKFNQPSSILYKITFKDGRTIKANKDHLWLVQSKEFFKFRKTHGTDNKLDWRLRTTEELYEYYTHKKYVRWYIPLVDPISFPITELPLHPYVLGCILGDGYIAQTGHVIFTSFDIDIVNRIKDLGVSVSDYERPGAYGLCGIYQAIKSLGLNGHSSLSKFIPEAYKYGSIEQRFELLRGLLDTDGTVDGYRSTISYSSSSQQLAQDVQELVWSLGGIAKITPKETYYTKDKKRIPCQTSYRVNIRFKNSKDIFYLPRKRELARETQYSQNLRLEIVSVEPCETAESICLIVDDPSHLFVIDNYIVTHNSQFASICYPVWEMGLNPNITILGVSSGADLMEDFLQAAMTVVEESPIYKLLFPNIIPDKNQGWSTARGMFVKRTAVGQASPTYEAVGYGAKRIVGKHARLIIVDDIHDDQNTGSSDLIEGVEDFYYRTLIGRQDPQGTRMMMIGRRWAEDDLYGRLKKSGDWLVMSLASIRDTPELYWDVRIPANISCIFNHYQTSKVVEDIKVVYGENTEDIGYFWPGWPAKYEEAISVKKGKPAIFETEYQSNPESAASRIFDRNDFRDFLLPDDAQVGRNYDTVANFIEQMKFGLIIQAWDTAFTAENTNDASAGHTVGLRACTQDHRSQEPNPPEIPTHYDLYILDEFFDHLEYGDLKPAVVDYYHRWRPDYVLIENSAAGVPIIQSFRNDGIQVVGVNVGGQSKRTKALNGARAGSAQGWARQGNILIPRKTIEGFEVSWAVDLLNELHDFTGAKGKKDDRVDSILLATNFAIDLGITTTELPPGWRDIEDIDARLRDWINPKNPLQQILAQHGNIQHPLYGLCGSCKNYMTEESYCKLHKCKVIKLGSCPLYEPFEEESLFKVIDFSDPNKLGDMTIPTNHKKQSFAKGLRYDKETNIVVGKPDAKPN